MCCCIGCWKKNSQQSVLWGHDCGTCRPCLVINIRAVFCNRSFIITITACALMHDRRQIITLISAKPTFTNLVCTNAPRGDICETAQRFASLMIKKNNKVMAAQNVCNILSKDIDNVTLRIPLFLYPGKFSNISQLYRITHHAYYKLEAFVKINTIKSEISRYYEFSELHNKCFGSCIYGAGIYYVL